MIRRRLAWLLLFGLIHGFVIWAGDILTVYACAGLIVLNWAKWPVRRMVRVAVVLLVAGQIALLLVIFGSLATGENLMGIPDLPYSIGQLESMRAEWTRGLSRFGLNAELFLQSLVAIPLTLVWHTSGVMLIGMALYRSGFFSRRHPVGGSVALIAAGLVASGAVLFFRYRIGIDTSASYATLGIMMIPGLTMAIGYARLLVPLGTRGSLVARALKNTGKTAFTLYISQSVISVALFAFVAPPLWGALGRGALWLFVAVFSLVQVVFAHWWQTHRGQGPLELAWRRLAYGARVRS
jgi:uncharacterized protein